MVNEFCGFKHGVIGTDKMPADTTLNNMKKADLIKLLHTAQHNYETLMWFYNNAVKVNMSQLNNNGWIPCSERLPSEGESWIFVNEEYAEPNEFIVQAEGAELPTVAYFNGEYFCDREGHDCFLSEVIAWQPLPAPYKKGE